MKGCRAPEIGAHQILLGLVREYDSVSGTVSWGRGPGCVSPSSSPREAGTVFAPRNPRALEEAGSWVPLVHCPLHTLRLCVCVCARVHARVSPLGHKSRE